MKKKLVIWTAMCALTAGMLAGCGSRESAGSEPEVKKILAAVQEAYGEDYLPDTDIDKETMEAAFGIDMSLVEDFAAQTPMISVHPDCVIIIKAKAGNGEAVEEALETYKESLLQAGMCYPANIAKTEASEVVREGDYAAYFLVGAPDDRMDVTEEEALDFAEEQTQKAVDAFESFFK